jgi:hypothetical protein
MDTNKHKILGVVGITLALVLTGAGCASTPETAKEVAPQPKPVAVVITPIDGYVSYDVADFGINLQYPKDWEKSESDEEGGKMAQLSAPFADDNDAYAESIAILKYDITSPAQNNLKSFKAFAQEGLNFVKDIKFTDRGSVTIGGFPGEKSEAVGTMSDGSTLKWMQYYVVGNNKGIAFTFTDEPETFDEHVTTANKIISTVNFK